MSYIVCAVLHVDGLRYHHDEDADNPLLLSLIKTSPSSGALGDEYLTELPDAFRFHGRGVKAIWSDVLVGAFRASRGTEIAAWVRAMPWERENQKATLTTIGDDGEQQILVYSNGLWIDVSVDWLGEIEHVNIARPGATLVLPAVTSDRL